MSLINKRVRIVLLALVVSFGFLSATVDAYAEEAYKDSMEWLTLESRETPVGMEFSDTPDEVVIAPPPVLAIPELTQISFHYPLLVKPKITTIFSTEHPGTDFAVPMGSEINAAESGIVTEAGWSKLGYGNTIVLHHTHTGYTRYAHLSSMNVSVGQYIMKGTSIGAVGCTGRCTGPHLHFEIRMGDHFIDPQSVIQW